MALSRTFLVIGDLVWCRLTSDEMECSWWPATVLRIRKECVEIAAYRKGKLQVSRSDLALFTPDGETLPLPLSEVRAPLHGAQRVAFGQALKDASADFTFLLNCEDVAEGHGVHTNACHVCHYSGSVLRCDWCPNVCHPRCCTPPLRSAKAVVAACQPGTP
eukprot:RCo047218